MKYKETLILVGHGSKYPYSKNFLVEISKKLKEKKIFLGDIYIGFMEFNTPTIPDALKEAISSGSKRIIVFPVFLALGTHTIVDIPHILNIKSKYELEGNIINNSNHHHSHIDHEVISIPDDVEIIYKDPIGPEDRIVDIIIDRLVE